MSEPYSRPYFFTFWSNLTKNNPPRDTLRTIFYCDAITIYSTPFPVYSFINFPFLPGVQVFTLLSPTEGIVITE